MYSIPGWNIPKKRNPVAQETDMPQIGIINLTGKRIPPARNLKRIARKTLESERKAGREINLVFVTDKQIRKLNLKYKKRNSPTDVLAFRLAERRGTPGYTRFLGDVVISIDTALRQAKVFRSTRKKEIYLYTIHGILHLLGYRDYTKREFHSMQKRQNRILERIWNSTA